MRKASTEVLEQGVQTPSPAPAPLNINRELTLGLEQCTVAHQFSELLELRNSHFHSGH
jgi:hypothetical protein